MVCSNVSAALEFVVVCVAVADASCSLRFSVVRSALYWV